jgi:hypothetical protein
LRVKVGEERKQEGNLKELAALGGAETQMLRGGSVF